MITKQAVPRELAQKEMFPRNEYRGDDPKTFIDRKISEVDPIVAELIRRELKIRVDRVIRQLAYQVGSGRISVSVNRLGGV